LTASADGDEDEIREAVWARLSPAWRERLARPEPLDVNERTGFATHLTRRAILGTPLGSRDSVAASPAAIAESNRRAIEAAFPGAIAPQLEYSAGVVGLKTLYSGMYAVAMWMLVFGFIGFFQHFFADPNPVLRYISDSSYWLYLLHLPLMFWIAMYLAPVRLGFIGKFICYNLLTVMILLPSYHYLVRSTFIGRILNGRRHPFRPFFRSELFGWRWDTIPQKAAAEEPEANDGATGEVVRHSNAATAVTP
jgi:hypothetical protein